MSRSKIHSAKFLHRHHEPVLLATASEERVTCLRCLYWLRRYIPVGPLLRKHQKWMFEFVHRRHY